MSDDRIRLSLRLALDARIPHHGEEEGPRYHQASDITDVGFRHALQHVITKPEEQLLVTIVTMCILSRKGQRDDQMHIVATHRWILQTVGSEGKEPRDEFALASSGICTARGRCWDPKY